MVAALCLQVRSPGAETVAPEAPPPVTFTVQKFWDLRPEQKASDIPFRMECDVTYFDDAWKILFVQDMTGDGAFVLYDHKPGRFPFKAGQHLLVEGVFPAPNIDISFERASIRLAGTSKAVPIVALSGLSQTSRYLGKYVQTEGFVERWERTDPRHLRIVTSIGGESVVIWVLVDPEQSIPDLEDTNVRVVGEYNPKRLADGSLGWVEIMVPSLDRMVILSRLNDDPRFNLPLEPIRDLTQLPANKFVRVAGQVLGSNPGRSVTIGDGSDQVELRTGQTRLCLVGDLVEAVGYPAVINGRRVLNDGVFRPMSATIGMADGKAPGDRLRLAAQVLELSPEQVDLHRSAWITGVVTWSRKEAPFFFVEDSSGAICVRVDNPSPAVPEAGSYVEVLGTTDMGPFAPRVLASSVKKLSDASLPLAPAISLERALTGAEEAKWVEMTGYLRQIRLKDGWNNLEIVTTTGDFIALLPADADASALVGAVLRLKGVCTADTNQDHRLTGIKLWVPGVASIDVVESPPKDPFDVPARSIGSLGRFNSAQSFNRLLLVGGVVLFHSPGHFIQIENSGDTLLVFSQSKVPLVAGDRIEAVGLLARQGPRVTLREAIYRKTGHGDQPRPRTLPVHHGPSTEFDGHLGNIEATLIDATRTGDQLRLMLQSGKTVFEALLGTEQITPDLEEGSRVSLTGVYNVIYDEYGRAAAYQINLRSPADIVVVAPPSWLTRERILAFAAALAVGIFLFTVWVAALRRQVREQTEQMREQLKHESRLEAELQRASKLESLGLLAGGIAHDFNNLLTAVIGNLSLARLDTKMDPDSAESLRDAEKAAGRAKDLTQQLLTFAKGGAPIQAAVLLPDVVREVAEFALRGSKVRCDFDIPQDLWPANVDKGQIGQVVQNIVINAMQAMPGGGVIDVSIRNETVGGQLSQVLAPGRYLKLVFRDHGGGIGPADLEKIFDPYFTTKKQGNGLGLATVHSIVKKHMGHISVESTIGHGSTFHIWLPAAQSEPASRGASEAGAKGQASAVPAARILFMDDELPIRQLGGAILRRMGYDATTVSEGTEAVREYAAAMLSGRPYSAVILDLTIPGGMGGSQTLVELRAIDPDVKAIVSSGYSNDSVLSNYRAHGFCGMVSKPYESADLALAVERVLVGAPA